ncbi:MAG: GDSL-type esterase/lipase family protein [Clostridium sp.]|nr:GDSL-type esterase/lipase family protein [Clostridium sp.]
MQVGNTTRLQKLFEKVKNGEEVTLAFIGGSITQGAGATPIQEGCYARRTYEGFITLMEELLGKKLDRNLIHYRKVGVGGTPSELGMVRYERDILKHGEITPDLVVVEFAVNDADDETHGICFESLVRTILLSENAPAVMLMFSVFADCWNLQDHLGPVGVAYDLPMVSAKDAVAVQFDAVGDKRLVTRNQYFFDKLHPSNVGHNIMADGLLYAMRQAYHIPASPEKDVAAVTPVFGNTFVNIHLLDRFSGYEKAQITEGSFTATDTHLQSVEKDFDPHTTPEFQYNWMHQTGSEAFKLQITCKSLVLVFKDSDSAACGKCDVVVNGEKIKTLDPRQVGWVHAHAVILIDSKEEKSHTVELSMVSGDEEKEFTILGFGYTN